MTQRYKNFDNSVIPEAAIAEIDAGASIASVAKKFNIKPGTIYSACHYLKLKSKYNRVKLDPEKLREFLAQNNTLKAATTHFGMPYSTVYAAVKRHKIPFMTVSQKRRKLMVVKLNSTSN